MSNVHYREVHTKGPAWKKKVESHAWEGTHFSVRPFQKQLHWEFLQDVWTRYGMVPHFDARSQTAYFDPQQMT